jgi:E3 ubiquitin-protein ligase TRIP12
MNLVGFVKLKKDLVEDKTISRGEREERMKDVTMNDSRIEDLCLDFTLPGYPEIELKTGGKGIDVDLGNIDEYISLVCDFTVGSGVKRQIDAFRKGMGSVFRVGDLDSFSAGELGVLFGEDLSEDWSPEGMITALMK